MIGAAILAPRGLAMNISAETVRTTVEYLAHDDREGRAPGTEGSTASREWLIDWLRDRGFKAIGGGSYTQSFAGGDNILAVHEPAGQEGRSPVVMIGAHYDHKGTSCEPRLDARSHFCNGAADNAAGVAAALAAAEALVGVIEAPVAVALWDAEESGLLGSAHFLREPTLALSSLKLYINLDIIGLNLFRGLESAHFAIGGETGGPGLLADIGEAAAVTALTVRRGSYALGHRRSDMTSFVQAGVGVPFVFLTDGDGSVYHTTADELHHLNFAKTVQVARLIANLAVRAARPDRVYRFTAPASVAGQYPPLFSDAAVILDLVESVVSHAALNDLSSTDVQALADARTRLQTIAAAGPARFGLPDALALGQAVQLVTSLSRRLPFVP